MVMILVVAGWLTALQCDWLTDSTQSLAARLILVADDKIAIGAVYKAKGETLDGVSVTVLNDSGRADNTDGTGLYHVKAPSQRFALRFIKTGYCPAYVEVTEVAKQTIKVRGVIMKELSTFTAMNASEYVDQMLKGFADDELRRVATKDFQNYLKEHKDKFKTAPFEK